MVRISVEIKYLSGVEDPEALTIQKNLQLLGYGDIKKVRTSKTYEFEVSDDSSDAVSTVRKIAEQMLANPVIQSYTIKE
ncbi:MAG: phosphoribosylformylglycinamidine synthase subunit PurS [Candidatus Thermoplasmatota archaeon]|nr:phosphoribosylformylglycinamidine synthase subunit PurS [Candidatus Thermoplasmatota archaeon]MDA8143098.1 phosphoribosylformylglycinamidine synthase subunit PurS [Thermoplasmatales archaeon]